MSSRVPVSLTQTVAQLQTKFLFKALLAAEGYILPTPFLVKGGLQLLSKENCSLSTEDYTITLKKSVVFVNCEISNWMIK